MALKIGDLNPFGFKYEKKMFTLKKSTDTFSTVCFQKEIMNFKKKMIFVFSFIFFTSFNSFI